MTDPTVYPDSWNRQRAATETGEQSWPCPECGARSAAVGYGGNAMRCQSFYREPSHA
jgi:hypothetical protein